MIDVAVFAVPAVLALLAAWSGWVRVAARSFGWLAIGLALFGAAALACWSIGEAKTGGYLAGIIGIVMTMLMGAGAAGMAAGALLRGGYELFRGPAARASAPGWPWDIALLAAVAGIAVMLSAIE